MFGSLFQLRLGGIQCVSRRHQILAQSAEPLLLERLAISLQRCECMLRFNKAVVVIVQVSQQIDVLILRDQFVEKRAGAMLREQRPHVFDLFGNIRALLVRILIRLKFLDSGLGLFDLGIETIELRLVLSHALIVERLLQSIIVADVGIGAFRRLKSRADRVRHGLG